MKAKQFCLVISVRSCPSLSMQIEKLSPIYTVKRLPLRCQDKFHKQTQIMMANAESISTARLLNFDNGELDAKQISPMKQWKYWHILILITVILLPIYLMSQKRMNRWFRNSIQLRFYIHYRIFIIIKECAISNLLPGDVKVCPSSNSVQNEEIKNAHLHRW